MEAFSHQHPSPLDTQALVAEQGMFSLADPVELVWQTLLDRRWHRLKEIAQETECPLMEISLIVKFLERYGFIQSSAMDGVRISSESPPSPVELAHGLNSLIC